MVATTAWAYTGRDGAGKLVKGKMDAASESSVAGRLNAMGLSAVEVRELPVGTGLRREISFGSTKRVRLVDLAVFARQSATMLGAGVPILRTLDVLAAQAGSDKKSKALAGILSDVRDDVERGTAFSDALARFDRDFPPIMINMVRAGETGGFLDRALATVAENLEKEAKLRQTIRAALTYPVVVLVMAVVAVAAMLLFIVPIFKEMFAGLGSELPLPTQALVTLSEQMWWLTPLVVGAIVAGWVWWSRNRHTEAVRRRTGPLVLRLPVFGPLMQKIAIARFSRNLANMVHAGVPILQSLKIVGDTSGNWVVEQALDRISESVRQGSTIAAPMANEPVFPPMVTQMVAIGEDSGSLEVLLDKVADFYEDEVDTASKQLTSALEPIMIAVLGVIIGGMVIALYLPIFSIGTAVQSGA
ncbi:type II secretion system F family protein [Agromyces seonyuensis]|uniref:Type II secretion system F family protein n=1 Tax=Agromyces seonyuensis TaxID=2662446 RepID=A0A6I4NZ43_9MICO|nr:type II secretion system F family protein [Agromyces seonyuensis]MWB99586.1 type II secretion system F family protein [Agromyces seonyuensis]